MEIGGYFELEKNSGNLYHKSAIKLNSGRNCIRALIRNREIKKIYLPYFICNAVVEACYLEKCEINYYFLNQNLRPQNDILNFDFKSDYLYLVNYAGLLTVSEIENYKKQYQNVILDNAQAFFMYPIAGIDTIYSCRKYFGVPDGAYLYASIDFTEKYDQDYSYCRMTHILGRYDLGAEKFYDKFVKNEEQFSNMPIRYMSKLTDNMMRGIDYNSSMNRRTNNYCLIYNALRKWNNLILPEKILGAFSYPLMVDNAAKIRRKLAEEKIFIPQYWKEVLDRVPEGRIEYQYAKNILWIPCDQRYSKIEIDYLIDRLIKILKLGDRKI